MLATTPSGSRAIISTVAPSSPTWVMARASATLSVKKSIRPSTAPSSPVACEMGLPVSEVSTAASSSACSATSCRKRSTTAMRSSTGVSAQTAWALRAAPMASASSVAVVQAISSNDSPVAGLVINSVALGLVMSGLLGADVQHRRRLCRWRCWRQQR